MSRKGQGLGRKATDSEVSVGRTSRGEILITWEYESESYAGGVTVPMRESVIISHDQAEWLRDELTTIL